MRLHLALFVDEIQGAVDCPDGKEYFSAMLVLRR
jgi:hypothetical protein